MKIFYFFVPVIFFIFVGCGSNYVEKEFSSNKEFYKDFNNSVQSRNFEIILSNDSSFISEGAKINICR
jgi:hypothetical protein